MNCKLLSSCSVKLMLGMLLAAGVPKIADAQVLLSGTYSQNFDSLRLASTWNDNVTLKGWYVSGANGTPISASNGSTVSSGLMSYGAANATDRALGHATGSTFYGLKLKNNTGGRIQSITVSYAFEVWKRIKDAKTLTAAYSQQEGTSSVSLANGWSAVTGANASITYSNSDKAEAGFGNNSDNKITNTFVASVDLLQGEEVMLRWQLPADADYYIALDDVSITSSAGVASSIYYSQPNGNGNGNGIKYMNATSSWNTSQTGSGAAPADFQSGTFIITGRTASTINSNWILGPNAKVIVSGGNTLTIPNNATLTGTVDVANNGSLIIDNTTPPTLGVLGESSTVEYNSASTIEARTYGNLKITGGKKTLQGSTVVNGLLDMADVLESGNPAYTLTLGPDGSIANETDAFHYNGKLVKQMQINSSGKYYFGNMGLEFDNVGGGNWGLVTITRTTSEAVTDLNGGTETGIKRSWLIQPQTQVGSNVKVTFKWFTSEDNGIDFSNGYFQPWKKPENSTTWIPVGNAVPITTSGNERTVTVATTSFSDWTGGKGTPQPLPVSWLYINGKASENGNDLTWATASEKNSAAFEVERSANGKNFEKVGTVKAAGNSNQVINYTFTDKQPLAGITTYYRLKQIDLDGAYEYSSIVAIAKNDRLAKVINVYPNPFGKTLNLQLNPNTAVRKVVLTGLDGKVVYSRNLEASAETVLSDLPDLNTGLYLLQLISDSGTTTLKVAHE